MAQLAAYRAGSVFLQVVPSFRGVQESINDQVKRWGKDIHDGLSNSVDQGLRDGIKKSRDGAVRDAGDTGDQMGSALGGRFRNALRNSIKDAGKDLGKEISPELDRIHAQLDKLGEEIKVDLDSDQALERLAVLRAELSRLQADDADIEVRINAHGAAEAIARVEAMVRAAKPVIDVKVEVNQGAFERTLKQALRNAADQIEEVNVTADISAAERKLAILRAELLALADKKINVDIDETAALGELTALVAGLQELSNDKSVEVTARFNAAQATASLLAFNELVNRVDGRRVDVTPNFGGGGDLGASDAKKSASAADGGAASWRAFNGMLLTAVTLGPLLVPVLAAITGGVLALAAAIPAAVLGVGILVVAFRGVGKVVGDLTQLENRGAKETADLAASMRNAANGVRDAQEALATAQRSAAEEVRSAVQAEEDAERHLIDTQRDAIKAQEDLNDARKQAAQDLEDLQSALKRGVLDERQAEIDLFEAQMHAQRTQADPGATRLEREEADIALQRAKLALEDIRRENGRLKDEKADADKKGIEGSDLVTAAQDRVRQALEAQADAQRAVGETARRVSLAQIQASEQVRDAQQRLTEAQLDYADAIRKASVEGGASARQLQEDLNALGPAGQAFAFFIFGLRDYWKQIRDTIQEGVLPGVQEAITTLLDKYGPMLLTFMSNLSTVIGDLFVKAGDVFTSPVWVDFFAMLEENSGTWIQDFATIGLSILTFLAGLATALAPFTTELLGVIAEIATDIAGWGAALSENTGFQDFLAYVQDVGPDVWDLLKNIVITVLKFAVGIAPLAGVLLSVFQGMFGWLASLDPNVVGAIGVALLALIGTFQILTGVISLFNGVMAISVALETGALAPILTIIGVIGALVAAFVIAYTTSSTFRDIVDTTIKVVGQSLSWFWENIAKPVLGFLGDAFVVIGTIVSWLWEHVLQPVFGFIGDYFSFLMDLFAGAWNNVGYPVFKLISAIVSTLWTEVFKPWFGDVADAWSGLWDGVEKIWTNNVKPIFDALLVILDPIITAFQKGLGLLGTAWDDFKKAVMTPVTFIVDTIINKGIIDTFNKLADFFEGSDASHIPHIPWPPGGTDDGSHGPRPMAEGGKVPGRSPNKRADNIPAWLTAGEFVMPVDAVDYYGLDFMEMLRRRRFAEGGVVQRWAMPAPEGTLGLGFGNTYSGGRFHSGQDFPARIGSPAIASRAGVITEAHSLTDSYGKYLVMLHEDGLRTLYAHLNAFRYQAGDYVFGGTHIADTGNTGNTTGPHLHFEVRLPPGRYSDAVDPMIYLKDAVTVSPENPFGHGTNPFTWFVDKIKGLFGGIGDSGIGKLLLNVPLKLIDLAKHAVTGLFQTDHTSFLDDRGSFSHATNEQTVRAVAGGRGWADGAEWEALRAIVQMESGFDNRAQNPTSTAYGLFQFLNGTWAGTGIAKTADPYLQSLAGMKYIAERYGDPITALAFHREHGYYSEGGPVKAPPISLYDTGGIVPQGLSGVLNMTGRNEHLAVLTQEQAVRLAGGGGDTWDIDIVGQNEPLAVVDELMRQVRRERRRRLGRPA